MNFVRRVNVSLFLGLCKLNPIYTKPRHGAAWGQVFNFLFGHRASGPTIFIKNSLLFIAFLGDGI